MTEDVPGNETLLVPVTFHVRTTNDARRLDGWLLALRARGIPAFVARSDDALSLHVLPMHVDAARTELDAVDAEDREMRRAAVAVPSADERFESRLAPIGGALFALALLTFYWVTGPSALRSQWFVAGASDATHVVAGEWWRTVTALTLHADSNHVLSNVALGTVVVTMVMRRTGIGLGAALVVISGALGNAINAWAYGAHHNSIGFSTAVFGAIGILGGITYAGAVRAHARGIRRGRPAWAAIAGSLALLGMFGASEHTDMLAHLFGAIAGLALGLTVGFSRWRPHTWLGQALAGAATIAMVVGAWAIALAHPVA